MAVGESLSIDEGPGTTSAPMGPLREGRYMAVGERVAIDTGPGTTCVPMDPLREGLAEAIRGMAGVGAPVIWNPVTLSRRRQVRFCWFAIASFGRC